MRRSWDGVIHLLHILKELCATPARHVPVIIVLFGTSDNERSIATRGTSEKLAPAQLHLAPIDASTLLGYDVPVSLLVKILRPSEYQL